MIYIKKKCLGFWGMTTLALLLNLLIINASIKNQDLLWLLIITIPLFIIAAYFAWQSGQLFQKPFDKKLMRSARRNNFEYLSTSVYPTRVISTDLKVKVGNDQCSQPYNACILNINSMESIDEEGFFIDTAKKNELQDSANGTLEVYPLAAGGQIWQIGPGYTGCGTENGFFNSRTFKTNSRRPEVKMIELNLSSAKNINYSVDSVLELGKLPGNNIDGRVFSTPALNTFSDEEAMIHYLSSLRELSGGKPIGVRICINDKKEFYKICYAIQKTQVIPDFIAVEGSNETRGKVHSGTYLNSSMPLYEALIFVSQTLQMYGLKNKIRIIADGRIISSFDILRVIALGADAICTDMPGYRIIKNQDNELKLSRPCSSTNVYDFHDDLMKDTIQMMKICGFKSIKDITLSNFLSRLDVIHSETFSEARHPVIYPGFVKKVYSSNIKSLN